MAIKRVMMMAGGTGGHVVPALTVAAALRQRGVTVHWLGTREGLEARLVPAADFPLTTVTIGGVRGASKWTKLLAPFRVAAALLQSLVIMHRVKPDIVIGMGGYVTGPGGLAAWLLRKPLVIHEQNTIPGFTNRVLAKFARRVLHAFPQTFAEHPQQVYTGNPVRQDVLQIPPPALRFAERASEHEFHLLVLGGSQGALALNKTVPLATNPGMLSQGLKIWHQTGKQHVDVTQQLYQTAGVTAKVEPYIEDMAAAYAWADLVVCRAGAMTVAELAAAGVASILIPFPYAVDDHQTTNAQFLQTAGGAIILPQEQLTGDVLEHEILRLMQQPQILQAMAQAAYAVAERDALEKIIDACEGVLSDGDDK